MKIAYINKNFTPASEKVIDWANGIISDYESQGYKMTLRQLYYQMVAADLIPNTLRSYKRIASIVNDARWAGFIDWDAIEDRGRETVMVNTWREPKDIMQSVILSYREDYWESQETHLEVMCEKDAVSNIIEPVCRTYRVPFTANRGYASASLLFDVAERLNGDGLQGKRVVLLYFGDFDPSGLDMDRDIFRRLALLTSTSFEVEIPRIALRREQVDRWQLPPNPAKMSDSRADEYVNEHGYSSWELDAIKPGDLADLVEKGIVDHIDTHAWEAAIEHEKHGIEQLRTLAGDL